MKKLLCVASSGGHWIQLSRLNPVWELYSCSFIGVSKTPATPIGGARYFRVVDGNRDTPLRMLLMAFQIFFLLCRIRPNIILSTGAAPGLWALMFGKIFGAKTVWIDSIANSEVLSLTAQLVRPFCDIHLTQWPDIADNKTQYWGNVL